MKAFSLVLLVIASTITCLGQVKDDQAEKMSAEYSNIFKMKQQNDSSRLYWKYDSAHFSNTLTRSTYPFFHYSKTITGYFPSPIAITSKDVSGNYKVTPIANHPPKVLNKLMYRPNRDMPSPSNLLNSNGRSQYPYYLRSNRYDWMIYRGN